MIADYLNESDVDALKTMFIGSQIEMCDIWKAEMMKSKLNSKPCKWERY